MARRRLRLAFMPSSLDILGGSSVNTKDVRTNTGGGRGRVVSCGAVLCGRQHELEVRAHTVEGLQPLPGCHLHGVFGSEVVLVAAP